MKKKLTFEEEELMRVMYTLIIALIILIVYFVMTL